MDALQVIEVDEIITQFSKARTMAALNRILEGTLSAFGLKYYCFGHLTRSYDEVVIPMFQKNLEGEVWDAYFSYGGDYLSSAIHRKYRYCAAPFILADAEKYWENNENLDDQHERERADGLHNGFTFPLFYGYHELAAMTFWADMKTPITTLRQILADFRVPLYAISAAYAAHAETFELNCRHSVDGCRLSDRERNCLQWAAGGKTRKDIGDILGISERTVNFHLQNAMAKLDTVSTTHAVARAIKMRLINLPS